MSTRTIASTEREPSDEITDAVLSLVWLALTAAVRLVWLGVLFPMLSAPLIGAVAAGLLLGWAAAALVAGISVAGLAGWRLAAASSFDRWVTTRAQTRFLGWWRYRSRWTRLMTACGLHTRTGDNAATPQLVSVLIGAHLDRITVRMLAGQCPDDYHNRASHLAHAFGALNCRATVIGPAVIELVFRRRDSLVDPVALPPTTVEWLWDEKGAA